AVPMVLATVFLANQQKQEIDTAVRELQGIRYIRPLSVLVDQISLHRTLSLQAAAGEENPAEIAQLNRRIDKEFSVLADIDADLQSTLKTSYTALGAQQKMNLLPGTMKADWERIKQAPPAHSAALDSQLITTLSDMKSYIGDTSGLLLDPDIRTHYVMS